MTDPFLATIIFFAGNFAPRGWAFCAGQILSINSNTALFSLLGTTYGGNGQTTFALPDFRGRVAVGAGQGPGLSPIDLGEVAGEPSHVLVTGELPIHTHPAAGTVNMQANNDTAGLTSDPSGRHLAATGNLYTSQSGDLVNMAPLSTSIQVGTTGNNQPHNNMQPFLGMNYIIALEGLYPSRN